MSEQNADTIRTSELSSQGGILTLQPGVMYHL